MHHSFQWVRAAKQRREAPDSHPIAAELEVGPPFGQERIGANNVRRATRQLCGCYRKLSERTGDVVANVAASVRPSTLFLKLRSPPTYPCFRERRARIGSLS